MAPLGMSRSRSAAATAHLTLPLNARLWTQLPFPRFRRVTTAMWLTWNYDFNYSDETNYFSPHNYSWHLHPSHLFHLRADSFADTGRYQEARRAALHSRPRFSGRGRLPALHGHCQRQSVQRAPKLWPVKD